MSGLEDAATTAGDRGGASNHVAGDRIQRNRPGRQSEGPAALRIPHDLPDDTLGAALGYADACWHIAPIAPDDPKHPCQKPGSILGVGWPHKSSRDPDQIVALYAGNPRYFAPARVVPDNDPSGERHAPGVLKSLEGHANDTLWHVPPQYGKDMADLVATRCAPGALVQSTTDPDPLSKNEPKRKSHSAAATLVQLVITSHTLSLSADGEPSAVVTAAPQLLRPTARRLATGGAA